MMKEQGMKRLTVAFCAVMVVWVAAVEPAAIAQPSRRGYNLDKPFEFAVGAALLKEHGFGLAARALFGPVGLEGSVGYMPWIVVIGGDCTYIDLMMKMRVGGNLLIRLKNFANGKMRLLLKLGGAWQEGIPMNGMEGHAGVGFDFFLAKHFLFSVGAGLQIVPGAWEMMEDIEDRECPGMTTQDSDKALAVAQPFIGATAYLRF